MPKEIEHKGLIKYFIFEKRFYNVAHYVFSMVLLLFRLVTSQKAFSEMMDVLKQNFS